MDVSYVTYVHRPYHAIYTPAAIVMFIVFAALAIIGYHYGWFSSVDVVITTPSPPAVVLPPTPPALVLPPPGYADPQFQDPLSKYL